MQLINRICSALYNVGDWGAQQSPINEARSLALGNKVIKVSEHSIKGNIKKIYEILNEGIYFIGFDSLHVGFVLKEKEEIYLIHSNFVVDIERIEHSRAFASYSKFYIAEISTNKELLRRWISGDEIEVME